MHRLLIAGATMATLMLIGTPAQAFTCYTLFDRSGNVVYRGNFPPVDMSLEGDREREALRAAGQYLLFAEADTCPAVVYRFGEGGTSNLSIENVLGGLTPMTQIRRPSAATAGASKR